MRYLQSGTPDPIKYYERLAKKNLGDLSRSEILDLASLFSSGVIQYDALGHLCNEEAKTWRIGLRNLGEALEKAPIGDSLPKRMSLVTKRSFDWHQKFAAAFLFAGSDKQASLHAALVEHEQEKFGLVPTRDLEYYDFLLRCPTSALTVDAIWARRAIFNLALSRFGHSAKEASVWEDARRV